MDTSNFLLFLPVWSGGVAILTARILSENNFCLKNKTCFVSVSDGIYPVRGSLKMIPAFDFGQFFLPHVSAGQALVAPSGQRASTSSQAIWNRSISQRFSQSPSYWSVSLKPTIFTLHRYFFATFPDISGIKFPKSHRCPCGNVLTRQYCLTLMAPACSRLHHWPQILLKNTKLGTRNEKTIYVPAVDAGAMCRAGLRHRQPCCPGCASKCLGRCTAPGLGPLLARRRIRQRRPSKRQERRSRQHGQGRACRLASTSLPRPHAGQGRHARFRQVGAA